MKIGDRVKLVTKEYGDGEINPVWGGKYGFILGTIIRINLGVEKNWLEIRWDNGTTNSYREKDLEQVLKDEIIYE